uniref:PilZ domain-containing protein n=1 Tax=Pseudomonas fluorescens (strain SBW25) TaxID=216595 RepID=A0A0G4E553_PSEFS|nr:PilZ domain-containing protein [Pseudomonas fluorescens]CEK42077.1 hypothetical protein PQBR57_0124 [Pseudomonas fluorescens SBW25]
MSESERRHTRYALSSGEFTRQRLKGCGFLASLKGWKDCRVKDMSSAGALLLSKTEHYLGDQIDLELTAKDGSKLVFRGEVVNLGKDHGTNEHKLGIKIDQPKAGTCEGLFMEGLQAKFKQSI